jgi:hypothetical protein
MVDVERRPSLSPADPVAAAARSIPPAARRTSRARARTRCGCRDAGHARHRRDALRELPPQVGVRARLRPAPVADPTSGRGAGPDRDEVSPSPRQVDRAPEESSRSSGPPRRPRACSESASDADRAGSAPRFRREFESRSRASLRTSRTSAGSGRSGSSCPASGVSATPLYPRSASSVNASSTDGAPDRWWVAEPEHRRSHSMACGGRAVS